MHASRNSKQTGRTSRWRPEVLQIPLSLAAFVLWVVCMEVFWILLAMLLAGYAPQLLFPRDETKPTPREEMESGDLRLGFIAWSRQCGWYLLVLIGFGTLFPEQYRLILVYLGLLTFVWLGWATLCYSGKAPRE